MTTFRSEETLVGLMAGLIVLPWAIWTVRRGLGEGRLPIGKRYVLRDERPAPFWALFGFYVASALLALVIALDLLFGFNFRNLL